MARFRSYSAPLPLTASDNPPIWMPPSMECHIFDVDISSNSANFFDQSISSDLSLLSDSMSLAQWDRSPPAPSLNPPIFPAAPANTTLITGNTQNILSHSYSNSHPELLSGNTIFAAKVRRRIQNREAQRKFRERKVLYLKGLEEKAKRLEELERRYEELSKENERLKLELQDVERKLI